MTWIRGHFERAATPDVTLMPATAHCVANPTAMPMSMPGRGCDGGPPHRLSRSGWPSRIC